MLHPREFFSPSWNLPYYANYYGGLELELRILLLSHNPTLGVDIRNEKLEASQPSNVFPCSLASGRCVFSYHRPLAFSPAPVHCRYSALRGDAVLHGQATPWALGRNVSDRIFRRFPGCYLRIRGKPRLVHLSSAAPVG